MPSGGTSDYAPEMIHAAAQGRAVRLLRPARHDDSVHGDARRGRRAAAAGGGPARTPDADGVQHRGVQPVGRRRCATSSCRRFRGASITFEVDQKRQGIVDSWPADVDDAAARADWGFAPAYDFDRAFSEYLIPTIRKRYGG